MKFDVLNRFSGDVQFTAEIECDENAPKSLKLGLAVKRGLKNKANLSDADLRGANLWGANGLNEYIKCIQVEIYPICYTSEVIQIGCERHSIEDWKRFDDQRIVQMDGKTALKFWRKYKDWIFQTIELAPAKPTREANDEG